MTLSGRRAALILAGLLTWTMAAIGCAADAAPARAGAQLDRRPNIVFITTDDQRLSDMQWMPYTRRLIGGAGTTFTDAVSPHPLCCPARAEFATGEYAQNNGVHHNTGVHGGYDALIDPGNTLGRWLGTAGYQTAMVGKYLNGYAPDRASVQGWDHWNPFVQGGYTYTHTTFFNDGHPKLHTSHVDDVVTSYASRYIRQFAGRGAPFFVWASDLAPHGAYSSRGKWVPPIAAARHRGTLAGTPSVATGKPSYGVGVVDGPAPELTGSRLARMSKVHVARIEALRAVDEGVRDIVRTLRSTGELSNTYVVFTTDNGYLLGEHGLSEKNFIFSEALQVPLLVRVPGAARDGATSPVRVTSVDIAPTIAELAGATPQRVVDGVSFAPLLEGREQPWRDTQLIQTGTAAATEADPGWLVRGVRTARWTYGLNQQDGSVQLYDRVGDPYELVNLAGRSEYLPVVTELQRRTTLLTSCAGDSCRQDFGPDPQPLGPPAAR